MSSITNSLCKSLGELVEEHYQLIGKIEEDETAKFKAGQLRKEVALFHRETATVLCKDDLARLDYKVLRCLEQHFGDLFTSANVPSACRKCTDAFAPFSALIKKAEEL